MMAFRSLLAGVALLCLLLVSALAAPQADFDGVADDAVVTTATTTTTDGGAPIDADVDAAAAAKALAPLFTGPAFVQLENPFQVNDLFTHSDKTWFVTFHASWCGVCHRFAPSIESLAEEFAASGNSDVHFASINLDTNLATAAQFRVSAIPAMYIVRDFGQKVHAYHPRPLTPAALRVFLEEKQWLNDEAPWSGIGSPFGWGGRTISIVLSVVSYYMQFSQYLREVYHFPQWLVSLFGFGLLAVASFAFAGIFFRVIGVTPGPGGAASAAASPGMLHMDDIAADLPATVEASEQPEKATASATATAGTSAPSTRKRRNN
ncbi:hypothetical protein H696_05233 [Fonticula alba]|uniref:Thioredoxin domain-containing protein n=1 Tax=Fonticula alba TaxID=691883 RepID=A0A058Z219_FONAL|nr:hypothetical protein H696_05233 [Fonticula alba]KCV68315.1 hypothetical protein H696_05233 [Fonticula alba]|eukprot:XP_009497369.1 hypothetical protein H696_05233 [Fonticula alba]